MNSTHGQNTGQQTPDWWARRPRRSLRDRKIAGVAGGLGRAFGIDPVLIRVAFVVLTIFGGVGALIYALGWLLLPGDGDEVSAAESLIGRGRSSVSPVLTVGLALAALFGAAGSFSWGVPFWPLLIIAAVVVLAAKKRGAGPFRHGANWEQHWRRAQRDWSGHTQSWGQGWGGGSTDQPPRPGPASSSPFDAPAFWEDPTWEKSAAEPAPSPEPPRNTPPAWDPLGAAPFAWDLPDVDLNPAEPEKPKAKPSIITGITLALAFIAGGVAASGVVWGWWNLSWAQVSGIALAVIALGLFLAAVRGRSASLIGPGVALVLVTGALSITGISGTQGYGETRWTPNSESLLAEYRLNAGDGELDLTGLNLAKGVSMSTAVSVGAGNLQVIVPNGLNVNLTCTTTAGEADCLGVNQQGLNLSRDPITTNSVVNSDSGTLNLTVSVGAGQATVSRG